MIELIHRYPIAIKVLLAVVTLAFIGTGGWIVGSESEGQYAAKVGDSVIGLDEYQKALYNTEDTYRQVYQGNIPEGFMEKLNLPRRTLDSLIDKRVLLLEAEKRGIQVSDEELSEAVLEVQAFKGDGGSFSKERYEDVLKANNMTPAVFERAMRQDMVVEKFKKVIKDAVYVQDAEVLEYYKKQVAGQGKEFKQEEFESQKMSIFQMLTNTAQDKTLRSMVQALRRGYMEKDLIVENTDLGIKG
ncbi:MAG: SurA N-terminal domain-containing protein [Nitrospirae bacterium]|nr:SurA N-terminal domain-containing protein [Nitrospirota bacterium]MBI5696850.1 SurA N-terminal domain-containing protein [Nitrospirota bacterium]